MTTTAYVPTTRDPSATRPRPLQPRRRAPLRAAATSHDPPRARELRCAPRRGHLRAMVPCSKCTRTHSFFWCHIYCYVSGAHSECITVVCTYITAPGTRNKRTQAQTADRPRAPSAHRALAHPANSQLPVLPAVDVLKLNAFVRFRSAQPPRKRTDEQSVTLIKIKIVI